LPFGEKRKTETNQQHKQKQVSCFGFGLGQRKSGMGHNRHPYSSGPSIPLSPLQFFHSWPTDVVALWIIALGKGLLASLEPRLGKYSNYSIRSMS